MYDEKIKPLYGPDFSVQEEITLQVYILSYLQRKQDTNPHELDVLY